jgi:hypothetical protein
MGKKKTILYTHLLTYPSVTTTMTIEIIHTNSHKYIHPSLPEKFPSFLPHFYPARGQT